MVAIYGAGSSGVQLASALRSGSEYACAVFLDDNRNMVGSNIAGIKVHSPSALPKLIAQHNIKEILLAMPSISKARQKEILDELEKYKVKIKSYAVHSKLAQWRVTRTRYSRSRH